MGSEIERLRRVSDQLCTGHAALRDRYRRLALFLDMAILFLSIWLVALAFVDPALNVELTPFGWNSTIWIGVLSIITFALTVTQILTDWKAKANSHDRSLDMFSRVKQESRIASENPFDAEAARRVLALNETAVTGSVPIPERHFLRTKRMHLTKVEISKSLDKKPGASIWLLRLKLWLRDNIGREPPK